MFEIIKSVIYAGGYKLADIQRKIKKLYMLGDISEVEMDELLILASGGVSSDAERPETLQMIQSLSDKITALEDRVKALEGNPDEPDVPDGDYPAWKPWDGISNDYQPGSIVAHNGKTWISVFNGQNVWEPGVVGVSFWEEYKDSVE